METNQLKALILGASGAVGRELVKELIASNVWSEVSVIVRRKLEIWESLPGNSKLKIIEVSSLDDLQNTLQWNQFQNYHTLFCCLGSRTKEGDAQFIKVDYTYCLWGGLIAKQNNITHYSLVSSVGADKSSMFLYMRTKGQIEESLTGLNMPVLTINRPGAILDRENDNRFGEILLKYTPFMAKIQSKDLAKALVIEAESIKPIKDSNIVNIRDNSYLVNLVKLYMQRK